MTGHYIDVHDTRTKIRILQMFAEDDVKLRSYIRALELRYTSPKYKITVL